MSDLIPYGSDRPVARRSESRQMNRTLGSLSLTTRLDIARIESAAEVQATRVDAVTYVGKRAMQDVAMLSQLEQQLAALVPMATGRLQAIGDMTSLAIAEVVADTLRRVR
jgi:hypothetical protein